MPRACLPGQLCKAKIARLEPLDSSESRLSPGAAMSFYPVLDFFRAPSLVMARCVLGRARSVCSACESRAGV